MRLQTSSNSDSELTYDAFFVKHLSAEYGGMAFSLVDIVDGSVLPLGLGEGICRFVSLHPNVLQNGLTDACS